MSLFALPQHRGMNENNRPAYQRSRLLSPQPVSLLSGVEILTFAAWSPRMYAPLCTDMSHRERQSIWAESHTVAERKNGLPANLGEFREPGGQIWRQPAPVYKVPETPLCTIPPGRLSLRRFSFLWFLNHTLRQVQKPMNKCVRFLLPATSE